jgi:hypothetical protein
MKTHDSPEIIEIIDDDNDAFGDRTPTHTMHDTGGPRWVGPAAATAIVALIGYGVATSASLNHAPPKAAPVTSTTMVAPTTTHQPAPTTTIQLPQVPYYAATPPPGYSVRNASVHLPGNVDPNLTGYRLWATTTGPWFSIETATASVPFAENAYRTQVGDKSIVISGTAPEAKATTFTVDGATGVTITSFRWSDDQLTRLVGSITATSDGIGFSDTWFLADHRLTSTVSPAQILLGHPVEQVSYIANGDPADSIRIIVSQQLTADEGRYVLDRDSAVQYLLAGISRFGGNGQEAAAGTLIGFPHLSVATWLDGENIVTVVGRTTIANLIDIAHTVRQVSTAEWNAMQRSADQPVFNSTDANAASSRSYPVPFGAGNRSIEASVVTHPDHRRIDWQLPDGTISTEVTDTAQIATAVDGDKTFVIADLPRARGTDAILRVTRNGLDPVDIAFNDVDPGLDRLFAAYAFSEGVSYIAEIVTADEGVLASWPSP